MEEHDPADHNVDLANKLLNIGYYYNLAKDANRARVYTSAGSKIAVHRTAILSGTQARQGITGIGDSISSDIDEYINTGHIQRLIQLEKQFMERKATLDFFTTFYGIGPVTAQKFYDAGYRTLEDLWTLAPLTEAQRKGIMWREHIIQRIPRAEMDEIHSKMGELLDKYGIVWILSGSYRRGESSSGDVDILIQARSDLNMEGVRSVLQSIISDTLAAGPTKFMGIIRLSDEHVGHRIDIRLIDEADYPFALLYFTGSKQFNILLRNRAIEKGLTLNEYGLFDIKTLVRIQGITTEADIFTSLDVPYIDPVARTKDIRSL
jgi:DNA polymerase/3'-5' exonuclease PolX